MPGVLREKKLDPSLALSLFKVKKSFGSQIICQNITLDVKKSKVLSILGPSGCGKTVTIKMIIGLELPDEGSILFDGMDIAALEKEDDFLPVRQRIAMVFQGAALFDSMDVYDNISYPLVVQKACSESEIADRVHMTLAMVGLPDAAHKMPSELSGGMKKRIGLARAIITNPEIILYDEPTAGLDPINTRRILDLILFLQDRLSCTSIVVTHDMPAVRLISDDVAFFYAGRVRAFGRFSELERSKDELVRGFVLGDPAVLLTVQGGL
ncbi:MAG: ATP-binding cassette domain-containing protein [Myxococcales bacterium]|nr:ATP-binding cassette domain-containing protein [Myxococcales bacterium]USN51225.1 MAG: ATP-binding cassette domain-containing protein [Myxococcales bacterium]